MYLNKQSKHLAKEYVWMLILVAVFVFSSVMYLAQNYNRQRVTLFFPDAVRDVLVAESRILPRPASRLERMTQYVEEYILGPSKIRSRNILNRQTPVTAAFLPKYSELVITLGDGAMVRNDPKLPETREALEILRRGILRNFPGLRRVRILIQGQEVFAPTYNPQ